MLFVYISAHLDVFERADLRLWGAQHLLWARRRDLHQVQEPFPIFVIFRPLNVKRSFDRRRQSLPQVIYLKQKLLCNYLSHFQL